MATSCKIAEGYLEFSNNKYFRNGAEDVSIGAYGNKHSIKHRLEVFSRMSASVLSPKVRSSGPFGISTTNIKSADLSLNVQVAGVGAVSREAALKMINSGSVVVMKFSIDPADLIACIRGEHKDWLSHNKGSGRVVHQVFYLTQEGSFTNALLASASFTVQANGALVGVPGKASAGGSVSVGSSNSISIAAGTAFAYGMVSLDWKGDTITDVDDDHYNIL